MRQRRCAASLQVSGVSSVARTPLHAPYAALVPADDPADLVALARLQVLNTVLLAIALQGKKHASIGYETSVTCPGSGQAALTTTLATLAPDLASLIAGDHAAAATKVPVSGAGEPGEGISEDTFVTTVPKTELIAHLSGADAEVVRESTAAALVAARQIVAAPVAAKASAWLAGDDLYTLAPPPRRPAQVSASRPRVSTAGPTGSGGPDGADGVAHVPVTYVGRGTLEWRNLLVSNAEYADFLNELSDTGLPNSHTGTHLLLCPMPHQRGGRLHQHPRSGRWVVSPGYEGHPVYWVTWIGAAAFAARHGARMPTRAEMLEQTRPATDTADPAANDITNSDYRVGDVTPVAEPSRGPSQIHHLVGNLQVWCADGPAGPAEAAPEEPLVRWLHGAAWNTPSTAWEIHRPRYRHLTGCSRGVGVRLVRANAHSNVSRTVSPVPAREIAMLLGKWIESLNDRSQALAALDGRLVTALDAMRDTVRDTAREARPDRPRVSQADVGLSAHVGAGVGETLPGQLGEPFGEAQRGQVGELDELHAANRGGVGALGDVPDGAASAGGLEGDVHDVGATSGQVIAHIQQPAHLDVEAGLLTHLPGQGRGQRLAFLDLAARQRPGTAGVGVLVEQQQVAVLDDDAGDSDLHSGNVSEQVPR